MIKQSEIVKELDEKFDQAPNKEQFLRELLEEVYPDNKQCQPSIKS